MKKVGIAVQGTKFPFDKLYSYSVPAELEKDVEIGKRVVVPFGGGNRRLNGMIFSVSDITGKEEYPLKPVFAISDEQPVLTNEMLELVIWLKENTFCTYYDAINTVIPIGLRVSFKEKYSLNPNFKDEDILTKEELNTYSFLKLTKNSREIDSLLDAKLNPEKKKITISLVEKGAVIENFKIKRRKKQNIVEMYSLTEKYFEEPQAFEFTKKQKTVIEMLYDTELAEIDEICYICDVSKQIVNNLVKIGAVETIEVEVENEQGYEEPEQNIDDIILTDSQQSVFDEISETIGKQIPKCFLLHGITGSGKTPIFQKLINYTVSQGRQALMLVPEIALTPQTANSFRRLFGKRIAIVHSYISVSKRLEEYERIKNGEADIVIGTRSAIFSPFSDLGIIVMDEEGDHSYKSGRSPRYDTLAVAKQRCRNHNAILVLASATPSIDSYYQAQNGNYKLLELNERYSNAELPDVYTVDMNKERNNGNMGSLSMPLIYAIKEAFDKKEQSIILLNRRGYNSVFFCQDCKKAMECPNCSVALTYHKTTHSMMCHYCGYSKPFQPVCPYCNSENVRLSGQGTQKVEEEISKLFPTARILRVDADTTREKSSYEKYLKDFGEGKYDIMLGTQMISRGLDFPNVTLVGVVSVDGVLFAGDFRAYEKAFSLVTQVVGRGGRGDKKGKAFIQTSMPEHYLIELAEKQDYKEFYRQEISIRKSMLFPPVCDICVIGFSSKSEEKVQNASVKFMEMFKKKVSDEQIKLPLRVLGPSKCFHEKINTFYRYRILIKSKNNAVFRKLIAELLEDTVNYKEFNTVSLYADINGETDE